jgi:hypothetical protein
MELSENEKLKELKEVIGVLNEFKKEFFLIGGSVLFAYRDKKLHPRNCGIAIYGFPDKDFKDILRRLVEKGFTDETERVQGTVMQVRKKYCFMIYFLKERERKGWVSYTICGHYLKVPFAYHGFEKVKLYDLELNVPSPVEKYITWCYGEEWRNSTKTNHCFPPSGKFI